MGLSNDLSCEAGSFSCSCPNTHRHFHSGLRLYFPTLEPMVTQSASLPRHFSLFVCVRMLGLGVLPAALPAPFSATLESGPLSLYVCKCRVAESTSCQTACPVCPTLSQSRSRHSNESPLHPSCSSPPLLPVWINVSFLSPWCWCSLSFDFLSVLVVGGGAVCLPTPPSWFLYF